jgi:hypothetical protein
MDRVRVDVWFKSSSIGPKDRDRTARLAIKRCFVLRFPSFFRGMAIMMSVFEAE